MAKYKIINKSSKEVGENVIKVSNKDYFRLWLKENAKEERYLFSLKELHELFPRMSYQCFKVFMNRCVKEGIIEKISHNLYGYNVAEYALGNLLYHAVNVLRPNDFNYLSVESVLSDYGIISQIPLQWIGVMTSGKSWTFKVGDYGYIEMIQCKDEIDKSQLHFYKERHLWMAKPELALKDLKKLNRCLDLVDEEYLKEQS